MNDVYCIGNPTAEDIEVINEVVGEDDLLFILLSESHKSVGHPNLAGIKCKYVAYMYKDLHECMHVQEYVMFVNSMAVREREDCKDNKLVTLYLDTGSVVIICEPLLDISHTNISRTNISRTNGAGTASKENLINCDIKATGGKPIKLTHSSLTFSAEEYYTNYYQAFVPF